MADAAADETGDPRAPDRAPPGDPWQGWKKFGLLLGAGFVIVFLVEMAALVGSIGHMEAGHERGAVWAMLLMIGATMLAVLGIGGGLFLAIRRERARGDRVAGFGDPGPRPDGGGDWRDDGGRDGGPGRDRQPPRETGPSPGEAAAGPEAAGARRETAGVP